MSLSRPWPRRALVPVLALAALLFDPALAMAGEPEGQQVTLIGTITLALGMLVAPLVLGLVLLGLCYHSHRCGHDQAVHDEQKRWMPDAE
ncbi:MAG TPA: hypothetical protein VED40_00295 [Azospirillaceae bacterium]|nr:hypothetical protein [Azospirillaceae bacterium]